MGSMPSPEPQRIITTPAQAAIFLVLVAEPGGDDAIRDALPDIAGLRRAVSFRVPETELTCVTGIGADFWDRTFGEPRPAGLHAFEALSGERHSAPSTPGDLFFHLRATRQDMCFELAQRLTERLAGAARVVDEVHGFRSFDMRDLLGFVDGTENPEGQAAVEAVLIGDEDAAFAGGSYVIVQKYTHDLAAWDALSTEAQEHVIGRTKLSDIELDDDVKPSDSHIALTVIEGPDGDERQILRHNMPFGRVGTREFGTYFIGYAADPEVTEEMLRNMFIGLPPGNTDRILEFSTAVTGSLFFIPSEDFLDDPAGALSEAAGAAGSADAAGSAGADVAAGNGDGSLGLGALRPAD